VLVVSVHVAILKVLSSYPDGFAAPASLNADLAILSGSEDWTTRMRMLAARVQGLDIFSQKLVVRDALGWRITAAGRAMLDRLEDRHVLAAEVVREDERAAPPVSAAEQLDGWEFQSDLLTTSQSRPQLTLIQGGRTRPREGIASPGGKPAKGAASRP